VRLVRSFVRFGVYETLHTEILIDTSIYDETTKRWTCLIRNTATIRDNLLRPYQSYSHILGLGNGGKVTGLAVNFVYVWRC